VYRAFLTLKFFYLNRTNAHYIAHFGVFIVTLILFGVDATINVH